MVERNYCIDPIRVLISAYSCCPGQVSEPGVAWRQVSALAQDPRLSIVLITRKKNVEEIEFEITRNNILNITVIGCDLPKWARFWKRGHLAMHLYYGLWQVWAWFVAKRLCDSYRIEVAHHISFMSIRTSFVPFLGVYSIVGPVGGAQLPPRGFESVLIHTSKELLRKLAVSSLRWSPWWRLSISRVNKYVVANKENLWVIPQTALNKCVVRQIGWEAIGSSTLYAPSHNTSSNLKIYWGGRLIGWKGLEILLRGISIAVARGANVELDVTGKGPDATYLKTLSHQLGLDGRVRFHGYLPFDQINRMQCSAGLIAFTSLHETTGTSLLEAMSRGKATIVIAHAGPAEIADQNTSWLVDVSKGMDRAVEQMAEGIFLLENNLPRIEKMGRCALKRIETEFSWENYIGFIKEMYLEGVENAVTTNKKQPPIGVRR